MKLFRQSLVRVLGVGIIATACTRVDVQSAPAEPTPTTGDLREITVTPPLVTLFPGDTVRLVVANNQAARWRSSDPDRAEVDSLTGFVRAKATGGATVTARMVLDTNVKGAAAVLIVPRR